MKKLLFIALNFILLNSKANNDLENLKLMLNGNLSAYDIAVTRIGEDEVENFYLELSKINSEHEVVDYLNVKLGDEFAEKFIRHSKDAFEYGKLINSNGEDLQNLFDRIDAEDPDLPISPSTLKKLCNWSALAACLAGCTSSNTWKEAALCSGLCLLVNCRGKGPIFNRRVIEAQD